MRFIIGLCIGTALVLLLAALLELAAPESAEIAATKVEAAAEESAPITAARSAPVSPIAEASEAMDESKAHAVAALQSEPTERTIKDQPVAAEPEPTARDQLAVAKELQPPVPEPFLEESTFETYADEALEPIEEPTLADADSTLADEQALPTLELAEVSGEGAHLSVWKPFHSEMSAQGFAKRLSMQLGYPFSVVKVAAAEYHVVFRYQDDAQRELLTSQLTALTGYRPQ